jgi:hypothetical protein
MHRIGLVVGALTALSGTTRAQDAGDTVGFQLRDGVILVETTVNGKGPFTFVVDTGAGMTVLKPETAGKLGLGERIVEVDSIAVGKAAAKKVKVAVAGVPDGCDGVLGYTFLSRFVSTIDYRAGTIRLAPADDTPGATLGFSYRTIPDDLANEIGLEGGLEVRAVAAGGPAAKGGLRKGDIIREVNGKRVDTAGQYRALLATIKPGDAVALKVVRDRKDAEVKLMAAERP